MVITLLCLSISYFLVTLFALSISKKILNFSQFRIDIDRYQIIDRHYVLPVAIGLLSAELAVVFLFFMATELQILGIAVSQILLGLYALVMTINIIRGRTDIDCGCRFLPSRENLSWHLPFRNMALTFAAVIPLYGLSRIGSVHVLEKFTAILAMMSIVALIQIIQRQRQLRKKVHAMRINYA